MPPIGNSRVSSMTGLTGYEGPDIPDSLILQWEMGDGSGTTVTDSIGQFDGELISGGWVSDSQAVGDFKVDLDGVDDAIDEEIHRNDDYVAGAITVEPDSWDGSGLNYVVDGGATSNGNNSHIVRNNSGTFEFGVWVGGSFASASSSTPLTDSKTRIGYRFDGSDIDLFYDGSRQATQPQSGTADNWVFNGVGRRKYGEGDGSQTTDRHYDGDVDNFYLFATSTASELPDDQWFTDDYNDQPWS